MTESITARQDKQTIAIFLAELLVKERSNVVIDKAFIENWLLLFTKQCNICYRWNEYNNINCCQCGIELK